MENNGKNKFSVDNQKILPHPLFVTKNLTCGNPVVWMRVFLPQSTSFKKGLILYKICWFTLTLLQKLCWNKSSAKKQVFGVDWDCLADNPLARTCWWGSCVSSWMISDTFVHYIQELGMQVTWKSCMTCLQKLDSPYADPNFLYLCVLFSW